MSAIAAPRQAEEIRLPGIDHQTRVGKVAHLVARQIQQGDRLLKLGLRRSPAVVQNGQVLPVGT